MNKFVYQICTAAFLLIGLAQAAVLFADPQDVTVDVNEWAQFNCTVRCRYTVSWYMAGHSIAIKRNNIVPGLLIKRRRASTCTESDERTHFFEVFATKAFNKSTFYCAAYETRREEKNCSCGTDGRCYSRPALLTVRMPSTLTPSLTTGIPEITPSPRSSPSSTSQETASPEFIIMTTTVTVTVTPTSTNCPKLDLTSSSPERKSSTQAVPAAES